MFARNTIAIAAALMCGSVAAHKINPMQDKYKQESKTILRVASEPVHEEITQIARACQQANPALPEAPLICTDRSVRSKEPKGNKFDSLVRGVWWNDDPNQLLFALRQLKFAAWIEDADHIAKTGYNLKRHKATIDQTYNMTYRGHYGDLQFIHAMASSDGESAEATQQNMLAWAEFAYATATGRQNPETTMNKVSPERLARFFGSQSGWTVNYLFAPKYRLRQAQYVRDMAAGSLLHMVQDSYSAAHAKRGFDATQRCPMGRVIQFHSYSHQDPDHHAEQDRRTAWQAREFTDVQDPVNASATLLAYIQQKAEWGTVKTYLEDVVFCIDDNSESASPGEFTTASLPGGAK